MSILASMFSDLDATSYFFVSSGLFTLMTASLFLVLGVGIGYFTWGRYKRRMQESDRTVQAMRDEAALLKRRLAELATRPAVKAAQAVPVEIPETSPLAALAKAAKRIESSPKPPPVLASPFTVWTEPGWEPRIVTQAQPPSRAFCIWTEASFVPPVRKHAPSMAFTVWTEGGWSPPAVKPAALPPSRAFCIWTEASGTSPAPVKFVHEEPSAIVAAAATLVKTVAAPTRSATVVSAPAQITLEARPAPSIDEGQGRGSILARAVAAAKPLPSPKATMTFADWLDARADEKPEPEPPAPAKEPFHEELAAGVMKLDPVLGFVFAQAPKEAEDLTRLDGLDRATQTVLRSLGVHTVKQISLWSESHSREFARRLGLDAGIGGKWIQQAKELAAKVPG